MRSKHRLPEPLENCIPSKHSGTHVIRRRSELSRLQGRLTGGTAESEGDSLPRAAVAAMGMSLFVTSCTYSVPSESPTRGPASRVRLYALPTDVERVCRKAKANEIESFPVLCPARLPHASKSVIAGNPPTPLGAGIISGRRGLTQGLEFSYGAPSERSEENNPRSFFHFALVGTGSGYATPDASWDSLGERRLGGRRGDLYCVKRNFSFHHDHVIFQWDEGGVRYTASLHSWGLEPTLALLDELLRSLRRPPDGPYAVIRDSNVGKPIRLGGYGADDLLPTKRVVWALGYTQGKVYTLDPETGARTQDPIWVGRYPTDLALDRDTMWLTEHDDTDTDRNEDVVLQVDSDTGRVLRRLPGGESPGLVAVAAGRVWALDYLDGTLRAFDATTGGLVTPPTRIGQALRAIATDDRSLVVLDSGNADLVWVDLTTARVERRAHLGGGLGDVAVHDGSAWVTDYDSRELIEVDTTTGDVVARLALDSVPGGVAAGESSIWVTDYWDGRVLRIDPTSNVVVDVIRVGGHPLEIAVGAGAVWVTNDAGVQRIAT